ncbi:hypothetical protein EA58_14070 [Photobacterium galatheae]|uniref:Flagellar hook-associated protein 1 n=3 Tax=Photobacterium galatheae TaxID=1654360 RepID=A0A066RT60_9GAMM|nr:hypothetical protein EA58_14070 [Photobacterium galatheae]
MALNQLRYATLISSQNINSADNPYYSRSTVVFGTDQSGMLTTSAKRMNNFFLTTQLHAATANDAYAERYLSFAASVDKIITGISPDESGSANNPVLAGIDDISEALSALATTDSTSGRSALLSRMNSLIANAHTLQESLDEFRKQADAEVSSNAKVLESQAKQLAEINRRLSSTPNDNNLLTQRDTLLGEMSKLVDIEIQERSHGGVDVQVAGGYSLVDGLKSAKVTAETGAYGDDLYLAVNGDVLFNPETLGGSLGGNLAAREEIIDGSERGLAKALLGYFSALNVTNKGGFTKDGLSGEALISIPESSALSNAKNNGTGNFSISIDQNNVAALSSGPMIIEKTASGFLVVDTSTGNSVTTDTSPIAAFGYQFDAKGTMVAGDKFLADPLANMLKGATVTGGINDIAAASKQPVASGDVSNLKNLAEVSDKKIFSGGKDTIYNEISNVFVTIGNRHVAAKQDATTHKTISETAAMRWANLSGVNTQEEELNMIKFQQIYQSVSKVIESDKKMFESIIGVV